MSLHASGPAKFVTPFAVVRVQPTPDLQRNESGRLVIAGECPRVLLVHDGVNAWIDLLGPCARGPWAALIAAQVPQRLRLLIQGAELMLSLHSTGGRLAASLVSAIYHWSTSCALCPGKHAGTRGDHAGIVLLAFAVARRWQDVKSNALEPGWVATKMGGASAPDDLHQGCVTQAWLATSEDELARSTGEYFYHRRRRAPNPIAADPRAQEELLAECGRIAGIPPD